tara:strand:+ start:1987 stop:2241 length:255 start_codon:yes stop_codon:yes gene_type:complete
MKIKIIKNKNQSDYNHWSIWKCSPSRFDWQYDQEEHCFIIKGNVIVNTDTESVHIESGDYVIFPKGLKCYWDVKESIEKYYKFK